MVTLELLSNTAKSETLIICQFFLKIFLNPLFLGNFKNKGVCPPSKREPFVPPDLDF